MHRDHEQQTGFKSGASKRQHARKEWAPSREQQHQMEAREHEPQHGRLHRTHDLRSAEAERQIRELRTRY